MPKEGKYKEESLPTIVCPACGLQRMMRVQRTSFEKILSFLTGGRKGYQKYYCRSCYNITFKSKEQCENEGISLSTD